MELLVYVLYTWIWWLFSASVGLPLVIVLKLSPSFRKKFFGWMFTALTLKSRKGPPIIKPLKERCLALLKDKLGNRKKVRILEIGVGDGSNLVYYPENSSLVAIDKDENFEKYFHENHKKFPQVRLEKYIVGMAENLSEVASNSVDAVVSTLVLCSVDDLPKVLKEVFRVLKPGGRFVCLEHVRYPENTWRYTLQRFTSPLWLLYFDGCHLCRDILSEIEKTGFSSVDFKSIEPKVFFYCRKHIVGVATK